MAVLDKHSNEMTALHLVKTYCLPSLLFGCEIWILTAHSIHRLNVAWNNCFRFIFRGFWRESVKVLQYYCYSLPVSYIIDQRRILFWKRMSCSDNLVLRSMSHFVSFRIKAVSSVYGVSTTVMSNSVIKDVVWDFFARSVL